MLKMLGLVIFNVSIKFADDIFIITKSQSGEKRNNLNFLEYLPEMFRSPNTWKYWFQQIVPPTPGQQHLAPTNNAASPPVTKTWDYRPP